MTLRVKGAHRQDPRPAPMVWTHPAILTHLSSPGAGDVSMTGTPDGVAAVRPGAVTESVIDGLPPLSVRVA
jgi:fumarylpyruvate hydrolase